MTNPVLHENAAPFRQQAGSLSAVEQGAMGLDKRVERDSRRPLVIHQRVVEVEEDRMHGLPLLAKFTWYLTHPANRSRADCAQAPRSSDPVEREASLRLHAGTPETLASRRRNGPTQDRDSTMSDGLAETNWDCQDYTLLYR